MNTAPAAVAALSLTPVKGTRLLRVPEVELGRHGVTGDRRFFLVDGRGRMVNGKQHGALSSVVADYDAPGRRLTLRFPDGGAVTGRVDRGEQSQVRFYSRPRTAHRVNGPWAEALSAHLGTEVELMEAAEEGTALDRGAGGAVSLLSTASVAMLAEISEENALDSRRFRMLVEIDGVAAHAEDEWVGQTVRIGEALVRLTGHVGRCLVTTRHPETGTVDVPVLDALISYRREVQGTEPLPLGVYGRVEQPGVVRIGDPVEVQVPRSSPAARPGVDKLPA